jgi:hypothetical protein
MFLILDTTQNLTEHFLGKPDTHFVYDALYLLYLMLKSSQQWLSSSDIDLHASWLLTRFTIWKLWQEMTDLG